MNRVKRDEQGVALVLALSFMVLIGLVTTALLSSLMSSVGQRAVLDDLRNKQYAADGAVERSIARVRGLAAPGAGLASCSTGSPETYTLNSVTIRVDCTNLPIDAFVNGSLYLQRNVLFTSCVSNGSPCTTANTIVRAQVNYEALDAETPTITKTYIQSWTVSR
jgi:hypothetical protein